MVIPPDFIAEDTSSDVIVPEGSSVKLTCRFVWLLIRLLYTDRKKGNATYFYLIPICDLAENDLFY